MEWAKEHPEVVLKLASLAVKSIHGGRTNMGPARPDSCDIPVSMRLLGDLIKLLSK